MHRRASLKAPGGSRRDGGQRGNASHARGRYVRTETGPGERVFQMSRTETGPARSPETGPGRQSPLGPRRGRTGPRGTGGRGRGDGRDREDGRGTGATGTDGATGMDGVTGTDRAIGAGTMDTIFLYTKYCKYYI